MTYAHTPNSMPEYMSGGYTSACSGNNFALCEKQTIFFFLFPVELYSLHLALLWSNYFINRLDPSPGTKMEAMTAHKSKHQVFLRSNSWPLVPSPFSHRVLRLPHKSTS